MTGGSPLVVDASAVVEAVTNDRAVGRTARALLGSSITHAPHLIDAELGSVMRRLALGKVLAADTAFYRLGLAQGLVTTRHELTRAMSTFAWQLRDALTFYDALYVALARGIDCPLVTADLKLAEVARRHVEVLTINN